MTSSSSSVLVAQRALLALSLAAALVLLCSLARRRLAAYEESSRARSSLLAEVLANVSEGLDRIEAGLDDIAARAAAAKTRLGQLSAVRRQNLLACAMLRERQRRQQEQGIKVEEMSGSRVRSRRRRRSEEGGKVGMEVREKRSEGEVDPAR